MEEESKHEGYEHPYRVRTEQHLRFGKNLSPSLSVEVRAFRRAGAGRSQRSQASLMREGGRRKKRFWVAMAPLKDKDLRFLRAVGELKTMSKRPGLLWGSR